MPLIPFQVDIRSLALVLLYLRIGAALVSFPTSTSAHPSLWVWVEVPRHAILPGHQTFFPAKIRWDLWEAVMVPLQEDTTLPPTNLTRDRLTDPLVLSRLEAAILARLTSEGFATPPGDQNV